jgi:hypothetical protein
MLFPAARKRLANAQLKSDWYVSATAAADDTSVPPMVPSFGAVAGIVNTKGSAMGGFALDGRYVPRGKRM